MNGIRFSILKSYIYNELICVFWALSTLNVIVLNIMSIITLKCTACIEWFKNNLWSIISKIILVVSFLVESFYTTSLLCLYIKLTNNTFYRIHKYTNHLSYNFIQWQFIYNVLKFKITKVRYKLKSVIMENKYSTIKKYYR